MNGHSNSRGGHVTDVGQRVRVLRQQHRLSQRQLAEESGLSSNALSLIERGKTSPTASTLQKLAVTLGVSVSAFFEPDEAATSVAYVKANRRSGMSFSHGFAADLGFAGEKDIPVTPLHISLEPGALSGTMQHTGQEFVFCLNGQVLYAVEDQTFLLAPGDSLLFDAGRAHSWQTAGIEPAEILVVLCLAREGLEAFSPDHFGAGAGRSNE